ncbi:type II secretion system F family protein [Roseomonas sp. SG15]|uniref:Type II secretion system F family protein n=2 Tax=Roseomonas indoligenes TaxID=2820811 RepID=A0A940N0C9_9PROT|nr:type II secretion system F family protein [Pararoseomonas indoligenes]
MEAADEAAVIRRLQGEGAIPMKAEPDTGGRLRSLLDTPLGGGSGVSRQEVTDFTRGLAVMLGAGLDLDRSLRFLVETAPSRRVAALLDALRATVRDGASLTTALSRHPGTFPPLYVGMVRAGEVGGRLAPTLERLAGLLERQRALAAGIRSAMIYPSILLVAAIGSIALLLTSVLPQFVPLFEQNGASLPASTQFLVDAGHAVSAYGLYGLLALLAAFLIFRAAMRQPGPRLARDRLLLRVPVLGGLIRDVLAARFGRALGTLLVNGVPLIGAMEVARGTLGNREAEEVVDRAALTARGGEDLSAVLQASRVFPPRLTVLLRLGHETAQLGPMALRAAEIHEEAARLGMERMVSLLVPAITILMGGVIAGIVSSLLLAMLSLNDLAG